MAFPVPQVGTIGTYPVSHAKRKVPNADQLTRGLSAESLSRHPRMPPYSTMRDRLLLVRGRQPSVSIPTPPPPAPSRMSPSPENIEVPMPEAPNNKASARDVNIAFCSNTIGGTYIPVVDRVRRHIEAHGRGPARGSRADVALPRPSYSRARFLSALSPRPDARVTPAHDSPAPFPASRRRRVRTKSTSTFHRASLSAPSSLPRAPTAPLFARFPIPVPTPFQPASAARHPSLPPRRPDRSRPQGEGDQDGDADADERPP
ncbi:hypothetical protein B0H16DRAFT_1716579 [Mycena metata]|uniref:Uncharacterized protein n=1 Tax=Mycena metata TaxID=1033252 RepID=A0AAD7NN40_9AGAR|nr:hypothetical protein B0H16DRAFT_1716579 [Mycena metata]